MELNLPPKVTNYRVDVNDPSALKALAERLLHRRKDLLRRVGYQGVKVNGYRADANSVLDALKSVMDSDCTHIHAGSDPRPIYYVYAHLNPFAKLSVKEDVKHLFLATAFGLQWEPFYIGKGTGERCFDLARNDGHRKLRSSIIERGKDACIVKIRDGLNEAAALSLEGKLIDILGVKSLSKHGILVNLDEGARPDQRRAIYPKSSHLNTIFKTNGFRM